MSPFVVLLILGVYYINGVISRTCKCTHFGEKTCDYDSDCKWYPDHTLCRSIQWFLCEMDDECRETRLPKTPDPYPDWPWDCPDFIPGSDPDEPTRTPSQQAIIDQDDDESQGKNSKHKNKKNKDKENDMDDDDLLPSPYTTQVDDSTQDPETTCGGYGKLIGLECGCVSDGICEGESCEDGPTIECDIEGAVCCCGSDCPIDRGMKDKPPPGGGRGQPPPGQGGPPPKGGGGQPPPQGGGGKGGDKGGAPPQGGDKGGAPPPGGGKGGQGGPPQGGSGKGGGQGAPAPPPGGKKSGKSDKGGKGGKGGKATSAPINLKKHDYYYGDNSQYEYNGYDNQYDNGYYPPQEPQEPQQPMPPQDNGYGYGYGNSYGYGNDYNEINDEDQDNDGNDEQQLPPPPPEAGLPSQDEPPPVGGLPPQDDDGNEPPPPPPGQGNEQPPPPTNGNEPPPPPPGQGDEPPQQPPPPPLPGTTQQEDEDDDDDDYDIGLAGDINIIEQEPNIGRSIKFGYAEIFIAFICMVLICCGIALCWNKKKYGTNMKKLIDIDDDNQYHYDYATFSNV